MSVARGPLDTPGTGGQSLLVLLKRGLAAAAALVACFSKALEKPAKTKAAVVVALGYSVRALMVRQGRPAAE
jgi:hypothetical protein